MKQLLFGTIAILAWALCLPSSPAGAQPALVLKSLAEKKVSDLPAGPLFWRIETFAEATQAHAAEGSTGLVAETAGKVWLFTLGPPGGSSAGAAKVAEIGPIARFAATQYLLRINEGSGPPGSITPVHSHPGSEAFYVLAGETSSITSGGVMRIAAGQSEAGHEPNTPMQVSSSGSADLLSLVMLVVDATKPLSSPAKLP